MYTVMTPLFANNAELSCQIRIYRPKRCEILRCIRSFNSFRKEKEKNSQVGAQKEIIYLLKKYSKQI